MYVQMPRVYGCEIDGKRLSCIPVKRTTHRSLIAYCENHPHARLLIRYPIGQHDSKQWKGRLERCMEVVMSESFKINKEQLRELLFQLYHFSKHLQKPGFVDEKLEKTWDPKGKITIYIVNLRFGHDREALKKAKEYLRQGYETMHVLHTSDNQEETVYFAKHIYSDEFLSGLNRLK